VTIEVARRYEQISPKSYEHPADRAATAAIASIPLLDKVIKRLVTARYERLLRQVYTGNAVQISEKQVPILWARYIGAASVLDIAQVPELFITQTPFVNGMTIGAKRPIVIVYSGLVKDFNSSEVDVVLSHELGHVLSEHYYYQTALVLLSNLILTRSGVGGALAGLPLVAVRMVLLEWSRAAELSSDRASALVVGDPLATCQTLMRLAGGAVEGMSLDAFLAQAARYADEEDLLARWSRAWVELTLTHPFAVKRARELMTWVSEGSYDRVRGGAYVRRGQEAPVSKELAGAISHYRDRFLKILEVTAGGVERALRQMEDWLRRGAPAKDAEEGSAEDL
jgi:Zn-dependent protease with chaperone function